LDRLWRCRNSIQKSSRRPFTDTEVALDGISHGPFVDQPSPTQRLHNGALEHQTTGGALPDVRVAPSNISPTTWQDPWTSHNIPTLPSLDEFTVDPFWPGIADFSQLMDPSIGAWPI
jgi:hypothetical protein